MTPLPEDPALPPGMTLQAFGQTLTLQAPRLEFLRRDALWRMRKIYEPGLASWVMAAEGVALDIGAGFGSFALLFAKAYPGWTVLAVEPDPQAFAALEANILALDLPNVVALNCAVGAGRCPKEAEVLDALDAVLGREAGAQEHLRALLPLRNFARHQRDAGFLQPGPAPTDGFETVRLPCLPAHLLAQFNPALLKLVAPQCEGEILEALRGVEIDHVIGETWSYVHSDLIYRETAGARLCLLPRAGDPLLTLTRLPAPDGLHEGLDVVVALYNNAAYIQECIEGVLDGNADGIRVLVVDDGSTDDSAETVRRGFGHDPRVVLLQKPNGGCASARNFGRLHSRSRHIAFVDADDVPGPGFFAGLLDLARQTGAEMVQGGFKLLEENGHLRPSIEAGETIVTYAHRHQMGPRSCHLLPADWLMMGQPSIWRRVYRRDFLDHGDIWFPEHIRAFDDTFFHLITLQAVANVPVLDGVFYHYRQHPGQDIRRKDAKHFYVLEMMHTALSQGLARGWHDFFPLLRFFCNTVSWVYPLLQPELQDRFLQGAAELWVTFGRALGPGAITLDARAEVRIPGFAEQVDRVEAALDGLPISSAYARLDSTRWHSAMMQTPWSSSRP